MRDYRYTTVEKVKLINQPYRTIYMIVLLLFNAVVFSWAWSVLIIVEHMADPPSFLKPFSTLIIDHSPHAAILIGVLCIGDAALLFIGLILPGRTVVKTTPPAKR